MNPSPEYRVENLVFHMPAERFRIVDLCLAVFDRQQFFFGKFPHNPDSRVASDFNEVGCGACSCKYLAERQALPRHVGRRGVRNY